VFSPEYPKKLSKILANTKPDEEAGGRRARHFLKKCDEVDSIREQRRKYGTIANKDLSNDNSSLF